MDPVLLAALTIAALGGALAIAARKAASAVSALTNQANRQAWGELYNMIEVYSTDLVDNSDRWPDAFAALAPFNGMVLAISGSSVYITNFTAEPETYVIHNAISTQDVRVGQIVFPGDEVCPVEVDILEFDIYYAVAPPDRLPESLREPDPLGWARARGILTQEAIFEAHSSQI